TTGGSTSSTSAAEVTSTSAAATAGATTTTAKASGTATTAKPGAPGTTSKPTQANGAPAPATPGSYDYAQSGSSSLGAVPANGTLTVDPASAANVQIFHRYADTSGPANDTTFAFKSTGPFIT